MTDTIWQRLPRQPRGYTHNENVSFAMSFSSVDDAPQFLPLSASSSFFSVSVLFWMTSALQSDDNREARPGEPCALGRRWVVRRRKNRWFKQCGDAPHARPPHATVTYAFEMASPSFPPSSLSMSLARPSPRCAARCDTGQAGKAARKITATHATASATRVT